MAPRRNSNPKGNPKKNKKRSRLEKRARRNVNISYQPGINSINRQIDQQNLDFQNQDLGIQSIYGDRSELKALTPQYEKISGDIVQDLQGQQAELLGALNQQGLPTSELSANTAVLGQQNMNNYNTLASNRERGLGYNQSALREHELSERYSRQNLQQQYSDNLQMLYNRMADIQDQKQPAILAELDRLREDARARRQEQAYADLIADLTGNALDGPRRRGPGPGPGNNGPGRPGPDNPHGQAIIDNQGTFNPGGTSNPYSDRPPAPRRSTVPRAWTNAGSWGELPPLLQNAYTRPSGQTLRGAFMTSPHPSFENFSQFQTAYRDFLNTLNQLWNDRSAGGF